MSDRLLIQTIRTDANLRARVETAVERMIALLDAADGDPDLEYDDIRRGDWRDLTSGDGLPGDEDDTEDDDTGLSEGDWMESREALQ
jgi:hypothetical protein